MAETARREHLQFQGLVVATLGASVLDVLVTSWALRRGWGRELNPFAVHSLGHLGLDGTLAVNLTVRLLIVGALAWIASAARHVRARASARWMLTAVAGWWTLVAISNVVVLAMVLH